MMHKRISLVLMVAALVLVVPAGAATFNILWYTGGTEPTSGAAFATYADAVSQLVTDAAGVGNTWNVTLWTGGALPSGTFNSLVVASPQGGWSVNPDYTALNASSLAGTFDPTTSRDMLTGQDADWHFQNSPGPSSFNGPQGFLVDSIDWASAGTGTGLVVLGDVGESNSLLDAAGKAAESATFNETNNVVIPTAEAGFPINTGLTSAGLSNWNTSAHDSWTISNTSIWNGINLNGDISADPCTGPACQYVTIVSANSASGGTGSVPEPASLLLLGPAVIALGLKLRRRAA